MKTESNHSKSPKIQTLKTNHNEKNLNETKGEV